MSLKYFLADIALPVVTDSNIKTPANILRLLEHVLIFISLQSLMLLAKMLVWFTI